MFVYDAAETLIADRVYTLRKETEGGVERHAVQVRQELPEGVATAISSHEIVEYAVFDGFREAQDFYLALVRTALHHSS